MWWWKVKKFKMWKNEVENNWKRNNIKWWFVNLENTFLIKNRKKNKWDDFMKESCQCKMATLGLSKVFILDKYFTELQKFWETEKKLQGERIFNSVSPFSKIHCFHSEKSFVIFPVVSGTQPDASHKS